MFFKSFLSYCHNIMNVRSGVGELIRGVQYNFESDKKVRPTKNENQLPYLKEMSAFLHENSNKMVYNEAFSNFLIYF